MVSGGNMVIMDIIRVTDTIATTATMGMRTSQRSQKDSHYSESCDIDVVSCSGSVSYV